MASAHFLQPSVVCAVSPHWLSRFCVLVAQGYASTLRLGAGQHTMRRADLITLTRLHHRKCGHRRIAFGVRNVRSQDFLITLPFEINFLGGNLPDSETCPNPRFSIRCPRNWNKFRPWRCLQFFEQVYFPIHDCFISFNGVFHY